MRGWHNDPAWLVGAPELPQVTLVGAPWVAWMYRIAAENAETCVNINSKRWQAEVDECLRSIQEYRQKVEEANT